MDMAMVLTPLFPPLSFEPNMTLAQTDQTPGGKSMLPRLAHVEDVGIVMFVKITGKEYANCVEVGRVAYVDGRVMGLDNDRLPVINKLPVKLRLVTDTLVAHTLMEFTSAVDTLHT